MRRLLSRNGLAATLGVALSYGFWLSRPQWDPEMRLWRAVGDGSLILLFMALALGPLARLWPRLARWQPFRRELGVWFGLLALAHTLLVWDGWARWDVWRFLGYEFLPQFGRMARLEPGFGLANLVGLVAMLMALLLMATSTDWAMRRLGGSAWKFLQMGAYSVFYLSALHTAYFLFMHYTASFHRSVPAAPNWFRYPFLALTATLLLLQWSAFARTVARRRAGSRLHSSTN